MIILGSADLKKTIQENLRPEKMILIIMSPLMVAQMNRNSKRHKEIQMRANSRIISLLVFLFNNKIKLKQIEKKTKQENKRTKMRMMMLKTLTAMNQMNVLDTPLTLPKAA